MSNEGVFGHVSFKMDGDSLTLTCNVKGCDNTELSTDGSSIQRFVWQPMRMDGRCYIRCERCGTVTDEAVPYAR